MTLHRDGRGFHMEAVEKQALATLLDQVCLLGVLWQLDLFEYGKLLVGEGFDDFETLSTMARQDLYVDHNILHTPGP